MGSPILWKSQLQTEIALSSTESEYMGLSYALRDAIPLMCMIAEMKKHGFDIHNAAAKVKCKVFEDNSGALEMAAREALCMPMRHMQRLHQTA